MRKWKIFPAPLTHTSAIHTRAYFDYSISESNKKGNCEEKTPSELLISHSVTKSRRNFAILTHTSAILRARITCNCMRVLTKKNPNPKQQEYFKILITLVRVVSRAKFIGVSYGKRRNDMAKKGDFFVRLQLRKLGVEFRAERGIAENGFSFFGLSSWNRRETIPMRTNSPTMSS